MVALTYSQYYAQAREAYNFVAGKMTIGAGNKVLSQPGGVTDFFDRKKCVSDIRETTGPELEKLDKDSVAQMEDYGKKRWGQNADGTFRGDEGERVLYRDSKLREMHGKAIDVNATAGEKAGCGNCEEQSSMVFKFLKDRGVMPLDWMEEGGIFGTGFGNHAFVILGRDKKTDASNIGSWNGEVVWCDPYEGKLGGLSLIRTRFGDAALRLLHRFDDFSSAPTR